MPVLKNEVTEKQHKINKDYIIKKIYIFEQNDVI